MYIVYIWHEDIEKLIDGLEPHRKRTSWLQSKAEDFYYYNNSHAVLSIPL